MNRPRCSVVALPLLFAACAGPDPGASEAADRGGGTEAPATAGAQARLHVLDRAGHRPDPAGLDTALLAAAVARADSLPRLRCLLIGQQGDVLAEHCREGYSTEGLANVKSVSKSVLSALVGIAIEEGHLSGVDQRIMPFFEAALSEAPDPRKAGITIGHLLSMQSGLERTSGGNYGAWVSSSDWVANAIRRPMVAEPGGRMLYSTGNYHLLSAMLTKATGASTLSYARDRLGEPLGIRIPAWLADPQGIYFGGNEMRLTPRDMFRFGELYRNGGRHEGRQVVPESWVRRSLEPRTRSPWSGEAYGYGWFLGSAGGHPMFYAWGYGGQFIFVVPDLELTMVTTSDPAAPRGGAHLDELHQLLDELVVPAAEAGAGAATAPPSTAPR